MSYATREIQHFVNNLKEAQSKRIILSLNKNIPDAYNCEAIGLPRPPLLLEPNKIEWQPANVSDITLGDTLVIRYVGELD